MIPDDCELSATIQHSIRAWIDGWDRLLVRGDSVQWHHLQWAAPGRIGGNNEPTYIDGVAWYPDWPDPPPNEIRYEAFSSAYQPLVPALPASEVIVALTSIEGRGPVTIINQPNGGNNYTLEFEFYDEAGGADWYEVLLSWVIPAANDCNLNGVLDECESREDCNENSTPDLCENPGVPAAVVVGAVSRKAHAGLGTQDIAVNVTGSVSSGNVTSEPRIAGIFQLLVSFDMPPGDPGANPIALEEQRCSSGAWEPYSGESTVVASTAGNTLVLGFTPPLENAQTYRITFGPPVTAVLCQSIEVRSLTGDVNSDGWVNGTDRSTVVGVWTGPGFSANSDINLSGRTDAADRSAVVGAWTGPENCAP